MCQYEWAPGPYLITLLCGCLGHLLFLSQYFNRFTVNLDCCIEKLKGVLLPTEGPVFNLLKYLFGGGII